ncbi:DJ-1/PfpI family protein [Neorhodopirellula pilleata]|uniref:General stress protein 18 n=1 Tax=Neorhodopirellula pilleata TaxID=2714738 RepID=A0A5C6ATG4_9BACT|nr:DJ-1/PfpI family protein [Neorhodopirellula pilleata]TWU01434.1 General stress protein 18 [Neorhodopirellula pilleata]
MKPKVLIIIGDASETLDTMYPFYRLIEAGFQPVVAAPEVHRYQMVLHEVKPGWTITKEWEGYTLQSDIAFRDINPDEYLGIFFSGGRAPEYIREDEELLRVTRSFFSARKPIMSVCHGVEIPARAGCVEGRRMATVAKCKFDLEVCGGIFVNEPCVIDDNLVSGRTFHDNGYFVGPWIKLLEKAASEQAASEHGEAIVT